MNNTSINIHVITSENISISSEISISMGLQNNY